jgi:N-acetylglutamate synthase and related acetyltransferases
VIREALIEDFKEIKELMGILEEKEYDEKCFYHRFQDILNNHFYHYYVYVEDNKIIGFISLMIKYPLHHVKITGEILELCVHPNYRNQRIGKQLIDYIEIVAKEKDLEELELSSNVKRKDAHRFYEKHHYCKDHFNFTKKINH